MSKNDFTVSFDFPFKDAVDASIMEIEVDEEMTEEVQTQMYYDLTVDQRESLKVYKIPVTFTNKTDTGFIIQLLFSTDIIGEQQYMGAFCPLIVQ